MTETIPDYFFSNSTAEGAQQLDALAGYLDPITIACLRELVPTQSGMFCLELGPGAGSMTRWLARRVGPHGAVVAVDKDPGRLTPAANLRIVRHDLHQGLPDEAGGPFQLIYARLLLVHTVNRYDLLTDLVGRLNPGGWLVIGEFTAHPMRVLSAAQDADRALYLRVMGTFTQLLVHQHGVDIGWGHQVHAAMRAAGLQHVDTIEHVESWTGGAPGNQLHIANISGLRIQLVDAGLTHADLDAFLELMHDADFAAPSWPYVLTRGQQPWDANY